jgi:phenylalanine-4-hydroxylase
MFHDLFGHTPLLSNPDFTEFFEAFGKAGVAACKKYPEDHEVHQMLNRIYWFNVEFGLIQTPQGLRAYGSGSVSSPEEIQFCLSDKCTRHPFDIDIIAKRPYDIWKLQDHVFVIPSFEKLGKDFRAWARSWNLL